MPLTTVNPFLKPRFCLQNVTLLSRISDPFLFQKMLDRYIGFLHWDSTTTASRVKLGTLVSVFLYYMTSLFSIRWIDSRQIPLDFYFGMWFLIGAGGSCFSHWICLAWERRNLNRVIEFLSDLQNAGIDHPLRARSRAPIVLFSFVYCLQNIGGTIFWAVKLTHTTPIAHAVPNQFVGLVAYLLYSPMVMAIGMISNVTQVMTFTTLLVFTVEFAILGEDFRRAFDRLCHVRIRQCVERHQRLLEMVTVFRNSLKLYLLLSLQVYFFIITYESFLLVTQLHESSSQSIYTIFTALTSVMSLALFGWLCDQLETKVGEVGTQVYSSEWPTKLRYRPDRARAYRSTRRNLLIVMMRSQQRIQFTCGSTFAMSLTTCWKVLELCYSAFTLLMSVARK